MILPIYNPVFFVKNGDGASKRCLRLLAGTEKGTGKKSGKKSANIKNIEGKFDILEVAKAVKGGLN